MKPLLPIIATLLLCFLLIKHSLDIELLKLDKQILQAKIINLESYHILHLLVAEKFYSSQAEIMYVSINALLKSDLAYYQSQETREYFLELLDILTEDLK